MLIAPNSGNSSKNTIVESSAEIATPSSPRSRDNSLSNTVALPVRPKGRSSILGSISAAKGTAKLNVAAIPVDWELRNTEKRAGDKIRTAATAEQAALTEQHYELSALGLKAGVQPEQIANASKYPNLDIAKEATQPKTLPAMPSSLAEDPTQGGRFKYETLDGGKVQVTDAQTGVIELDSGEQANAYQQQGKPYLDKVGQLMPAICRCIRVWRQAQGNPKTHLRQRPKCRLSRRRRPRQKRRPKSRHWQAWIQEKNITVTMPNVDVGQDVKDRRIAHIVSGGLGG
jgi:hypothetical protein